ncbi:MAG TPA: fumarylacetoacetate hydrolase family protein [Acidimicrobiales bacterium]
MLSAAERKEAAEALLAAARDHTVISPISVTYPAAEVEDAYRISQAVAESKLQSGAILKGHKVGLTSRPMQEAAGINEPDYGVLLDDLFVAEGSVIPTERLFQPLAEAELAFVLREPLVGPSANAADVVRATDFILPCIEIVDRRFNDRGVLVDTIADNASSGLVVLGGNPVGLGEIDIRTIGVTLSKNGVIEDTGVASAVMGNPINAVAWLANKLHSFGVPLEAGHVVLSGSFIKAIRFGPGDVMVADFTGLGMVQFAVAR